MSIRRGRPQHFVHVFCLQKTMPGTGILLASNLPLPGGRGGAGLP